MTKTKIFFHLFLLFIVIDSTYSTEDFLDQRVNSLSYFEDETSSIRNLFSTSGSEHSQRVKLYMSPNYQGLVKEIISGTPTRFIKRSNISFMVGDKVTFRLIDFSNSIAYKFKKGDKVIDMVVESSDWMVTVDHPRPLDNRSIMLFEHAECSGNFKILTIEHGLSIHSSKLKLVYKSITFAINSRVARAILYQKDDQDFTVIKENAAFEGNNDFITLMEHFNEHSLYVLEARTDKMQEFKINRQTRMLESLPPIHPGLYVIMAGKQIYARIKNNRSSYIISGEKPYLYVQLGEKAQVALRELDYVPQCGCVYTYCDEVGFDGFNEVCYTNDPEENYHFDLKMRYVVFPQDYSVTGLLLIKEKNDGYIRIDSGIVPYIEGTKIIGAVIVPEIRPDQAKFFPNYNFKNYNPVVTITEGVVLKGIGSLLLGSNVQLGIVNVNDSNEVFLYPQGSAIPQINFFSQRYVATFNVYEKLADTVSSGSCVRIYPSCSNFSLFKEICSNKSDSYDIYKPVDIRLIVFPRTQNVQKLILLDHLKFGFDKEYHITKTTCLEETISAAYRKITMMPIVPSGKIYVYNHPNYAGDKYVLSSDDYAILNTHKVPIISVAFGNGSKLRIVDATQKTITEYTSNQKEINVKAKEIYVQSGDGEIVNQSLNLWTFDDNYKHFRVLPRNKHLFENDEIDFITKIISFPIENTIEKIILINREWDQSKILENNGKSYTIDYKSKFRGIERAIVIPRDWDKVLLAKKDNFYKFMATMDNSNVLKLKMGSYSFVNSLKNPLKIFNFSKLVEKKFDPKRVFKYYPPGTINYDLYIETSGFYNFIIGDGPPSLYAPQCFFTFDDCLHTKNIRRFCSSDKAYVDKKYFTITTNSSYMALVVSDEIVELNMMRKYSQLKVDGNLINESKCLSVEKGSAIEVQFIKKKK